MTLGRLSADPADALLERRLQWVRRLTMVQQAIKDRPGLPVLTTVTDRLLARLVDAPRADAGLDISPDLVPVLTIQLEGVENETFFEPGLSPLHISPLCHLAWTAPESRQPLAVMPVTFHVSDVQMVWERCQPEKIVLPQGMGYGEIALRPNPRHQVLTGKVALLRMRLLDEPGNIQWLTRLSQARDALKRTRRLESFKPSSRPCSGMSVKYRIRGRVAGVMQVPWPRAWTADGDSAWTREVAVSLMHDDTLVEAAAAWHPNGRSSGPWPAEGWITRQEGRMRGKLLRALAEKMHRLMADRIALHEENPSVQSAMHWALRAEWALRARLYFQQADALKSMNAQGFCEKASVPYQVMLNGDLDDSGGWETPAPGAVVAPARSVSGQTDDRDGRDWCHVRRGARMHTGVMIAPGIVAASLSSLEDGLGGGFQIAWPNGAIVEARLWAWDRQQRFVLVRAAMDKLPLVWPPCPDGFRPPQGIARAAESLAILQPGGVKAMLSYHDMDGAW